MADTYTVLRKKYTDLAAERARQAIPASGCEITVLRYQLGLEVQCCGKTTCVSTKLDWMLVFATHDPQALFDYHISKLVAQSRVSSIEQARGTWWRTNYAP